MPALSFQVFLFMSEVWTTKHISEHDARESRTQVWDIIS